MNTKVHSARPTRSAGLTSTARKTIPPCRRWQRLRLIRSLVLLGLALGVSPGEAGTITWTNLDGGLWNVATNWSPRQVPGAADTVLITNAGSYTVTQNVNVSVASLALGGPAGRQALDWTAGSFSGALTVSSNGALNIVGPATGGSLRYLYGMITNGGTITWTGTGELRLYADGTARAWIENLQAGRIEIRNSQTLGTGGDSPARGILNRGLVLKTVDAGTMVLGVGFVNEGRCEILTGRIALGNTFYNGPGAVLTGDLQGSGTLAGYLSSEVNWLASSMNFDLTIQTNGVLNIDLPSQADFSGVISNAGTINWSGLGNLRFYAYYAEEQARWENLPSGTVNILNSRTLLTAGSSSSRWFRNSGTVRKSLDPGTMGLTLPFENAGRVEVAAGRLALGTTFYNHPGAVLTGDLQGSGTLAGSLSSEVNWVANSMAFDLTIQTNGVLNIDLPSQADFSGVITNAGTINWSGLGNLRFYAYYAEDQARLENLGSGTVNLLNSRTLLTSGSSASRWFRNYGTVRKSLDTGTLGLALPFENAGRFEVALGRLALGSTFYNHPGAVLTGDFQGAGTLAGYLSTEVNWLAGSMAFDLTIQTNGVLNIDLPSQVDFSGVITNAGTINWSGLGNLRFYAYYEEEQARLENLESGTFHILNNRSLLTAGSSASRWFRNYGLVRKTDLDAVTSIGLPFQQYGAIEVETGTLVLGGGYIQVGGRLSFGLNNVTNYGNLDISGTAPLNGTVEVHLNGGYLPATGDAFALVTYNARTGLYTNVTLPPNRSWRTNYTATAFILNAIDAQPDLLVRRDFDASYLGTNLYNLDGAGQTVVARAGTNVAALYYLRLENDGDTTNGFIVRGAPGSNGWSVAYYDGVAGNTDVTSLLVGLGKTNTLAPHGTWDFRATLTPGPAVAEGDVMTVLVNATAMAFGAQADTVKLIAIRPSPHPLGAVYNDCTDFQLGSLVGLRCTNGQLRLGLAAQTLPYLWVPNSNEGTVSKVDARTGQELGRYRTGPTATGDPSRTTVDLQGNCWVANRVSGTILKIGLLESGQYLDRNGDGLVQTSRDLDGDGNITGDELLPWGQDECVLYEVSVIPGREGTYRPGTFPGPYATNYWNPGPRGLAVDAAGNVWVGTHDTMKFYYLDGATARLLRTNDVSAVGHTSYGAVLDANGILWSSGYPASHVLRFDPTLNTFSKVEVGHIVYGLGLDRHQHLFVSGWTDQKLSRLNVLTSQKEWTTNAPTGTRGVVVTDEGDVWTADSTPGTVTRYSNDGSLKAAVLVGSEPTGVSVDSAGKVWVVNNGDEYIKRIDPVTDAVDLSKRLVGGRHYGYSDMTGLLARQVTSRVGTWTVTHDSQFTNTVWDSVCWSALDPSGSNLTVLVRGSRNGQSWSPWETAGNCLSLSATPPGQFLQIQVTLRFLAGFEEPALFSLTLNPVAAPVIVTPPASQAVFVGENVSLRVAAAGTRPLAYQWSLNGTDLLEGKHIHGSTTDTLVLTDVQLAHAGYYTVAVSNAFGVVSNDPPAQLVVAEVPPFQASHSTDRYLSPGTNLVTCQVGYPAGRDLYALLWRVGLPIGWELLSAEGDGQPVVYGDEIIFLGSLASNFLRFTYSVAIPPGHVGPKNLGGTVEFWMDGMLNPAAVPAQPDPLPLQRSSYHSADYAAPRWVIDGTEAARVVTYWRAGAYHAEPLGWDGFTAGPGDTNSMSHSADFRAPRWQMDGTELNRVLAYWRTNGYHVEPAGDDGYAPGAPGSGGFGPSSAPKALPLISHRTLPAYQPGATLSVTNTFEHSGPLLSLLWRPRLPVGWTLLSAAGPGAPEAAHGEIVWVAPALPPSPITMVYSVQTAPGDSGNKELRAEVEYHLAGQINPASLAALADPLTLAGPVALRFVPPLFRDPTGRFVMHLVSPPGARLEIQVSTNLLRWDPLITLTNLTGSSPFTDETAVRLPSRFYRAVLSQ